MQKTIANSCSHCEKRMSLVLTMEAEQMERNFNISQEWILKFFLWIYNRKKMLQITKIHV